MLWGTSAALPAGPRGSPMSLAVSTSPASPPSAAPTWLPNMRAAGLADHPDQRAGHRPRLLGHRVAHGADDVLGDRLDEHLPHLGGLLDPLGAAPGRGGGHAGGQHGGARRASGRPAAARRRPGSGRRGRGWGRAPGRWYAGRCRWRGSSSPARRTAPSWPASGPSGPRGRASARPGRRPPRPPPPRAPKICSKGVPLNGFWSPSESPGSGLSGSLLMRSNVPPATGGPRPAGSRCQPFAQGGHQVPATWC